MVYFLVKQMSLSTKTTTLIGTIWMSNGLMDILVVLMKTCQKFRKISALAN